MIPGRLVIVERAPTLADQPAAHYNYSKPRSST